MLIAEKTKVIVIGSNFVTILYTTSISKRPINFFRQSKIWELDMIRISPGITIFPRSHENLNEMESVLKLGWPHGLSWGSVITVSFVVTSLVFPLRLVEGFPVQYFRLVGAASSNFPLGVFLFIKTKIPSRILELLTVLSSIHSLSTSY